jgi:hypothetical protein
VPQAWRLITPVARFPQFLPGPSPGLFSALPAPSAPSLAGEVGVLPPPGAWCLCLLLPWQAGWAWADASGRECTILGGIGLALPFGRLQPSSPHHLMFAHDPHVLLSMPPFPQLRVPSLVAR